MMTTVKTTELDLWTAKKEEHCLMIERAKILAKADLLPPTFKDKPANIMIALEIARELGINFLMVMQGIYFIHGKPSFTSSFIIALLNNSKEFRTINYEFSADRSSCRVIATKEKGGVVEGPVVSLEIARAEGWLTKPGSKWKTMPDLMLRYRAATFFCRVCAPHLLFGFHTDDEIKDFVPPVAATAEKNKTPNKEEKEEPIVKTRSYSTRTVADIFNWGTDEN